MKINQNMQNEILITIAILSYLLVIGYCRDTTTKPKEVVQHGNLECPGDIRAKSLTISLNKDFYSNDAEMDIVHASEIHCSKLITQKILTSVILANNKMNMLFINSFLKVKGQISYGKDKKPQDGTSFIQLGPENIYLNNIRQWKLVKEFDLSVINKELNIFIRNILLVDIQETQKKVKVGRLFEAVKTINHEMISKFMKNYEHIIVETNFKFVNSIWNDNTAYIKINDNLYWMDHHNWEENSTKGQECELNIWNSPIRIILPKRIIKNSTTSSDNLITVTFGIKLSESFNKEKLKLTDCVGILPILNKNEGINFDNLHISIK